MVFDVADALILWERGEQATPFERAHLLLERALPDYSAEEVLHLSIGERDRALTELRRAWFGDAFEGYVDCPRCAERLEVALDLAAFGAQSNPVQRFITRDGYGFRPPDVSDLAAIAAAGDTAEAVQELLRRCCTEAPGDVPEAWSAAQIAEINAGLAALESDAELHASFSCANCGHAWDTALDPLTFLWEEVESIAIQSLHAVHRLASAYGWSEREILSLPAKRRETYLAFLGT